MLLIPYVFSTVELGTWRQFILALVLHTKEEMVEDGFEAYWSGSERVIPNKGDLRDYWMQISRQALEKVTDVDLFYLCNMNRGTSNVPYLLAWYLFRYDEGRKSEARLSGGHFIRYLAAHFRLVSDQGLRGLSVAAAAGAPGAAEDALAADEGAQAVPSPIKAPQPPSPAPRHQTMS
nr:hypothetical protein [Tanacetum cinerariifolium]